jgi:subtilisin family serine protease
VDYFLAAGGLIFKAARNANNQTADYLCGRTDICSVAATNASDQKASFSSYGTWVDISAPGDAATMRDYESRASWRPSAQIGARRRRKTTRPAGTSRRAAVFLTNQQAALSDMRPAAVAGGSVRYFQL